MDKNKSIPDIYSTLAKELFNLPCTVEEVPTLYKEERQQAKRVLYKELYGPTEATQCTKTG